MAKVTFRRGTSTLYKERWESYNNGDQTYSYLKNALYFAEDTHQIYLDGNNFSFDSDNIDLSNLVTSIDYDSSTNAVTVKYSDEDKADSVFYLYKVELKDESGPLTLDVSVAESGQKIYQIGMKTLDNISLSNITSTTDASANIQNGDSIIDAFNKVNNSITWVDVPDNE